MSIVDVKKECNLPDCYSHYIVIREDQPDYQIWAKDWAIIYGALYFYDQDGYPLTAFNRSSWDQVLTYDGAA